MKLYIQLKCLDFSLIFYITFAYKEDKKMDTTTVRKPASFRLNAELLEMLKRYKHEKGN